jgi:HD-like signal output (HDOD) protein
MIETHVLTKLLQNQELPTLPEIVAKVLEITGDEKSSADDAARLLESDPVISARLLRAANSSFYSIRCQVGSIPRAVVVLGFEAVRGLALSTAVFDSLSQKRQFTLDPEDFWMHSLGTAKAAHLLARKYCPAASKEGCFTAGLLHDVGKYILALALKAEYQSIVQAARVSQCALRDVEKEKLKTNHSEVGGWIAEEWGFPPLLVEVIRFATCPQEYSGPHKAEVETVALADGLSRLADFGCAGDWDEPPVKPDLLVSLGLIEEAVEDIVEELKQFRGETQQFLRLMKEKI